MLNRNSQAVSYQRRIATCIAGLAALILGDTALAQGSANWKDIVAAANKEGRVVVFSAQGPSVLERVKSDFEKTYPGIKLEQTRFSSGPMMSRLDQERASNADGGDVTITTELGWLDDRAKENALRTPVGPNAAAWPAAFMKGAYPVLALEPFGIAYNTNLVKTPVTGYRDLLRPEFTGKVGMIDLVATSLIAYYDWLEKKEGGDFLAKLGAQKPKIYGSNPIGAQMVASGELPVVSFMSATMVLPLVTKGAPVKLVYPDAPFGIQYAGGIVGWSKRPNAAQVYMDYIMSRAGQTAWNGLGEAASPLPNIPGSGDARNIVPYDPAKYTPEVIKNFRARWDGLIKK